MKFSKESFISKTNRDLQIGKVMVLKQRFPKNDPDAYERYYSSEAFKASELPQYFNEEYILRVCKDSHNPIITYLNINEDIIDSINESKDSVYIFNAHYIKDEGFVDWFFSEIKIPTAITEEEENDKNYTYELPEENHEPKKARKSPSKSRKGIPHTNIGELEYIKSVKKLDANELKEVYKIGKKKKNSFGIIDRGTHFSFVINGFETDLAFNSMQDILNSNKMHVISGKKYLSFKSELINSVNKPFGGLALVSKSEKNEDYVLPGVIKHAIEKRAKKQLK